MHDPMTWLNLLLVPTVGLLLLIRDELSTLTAIQATHTDRIRKLERSQPWPR